MEKWTEIVSLFKKSWCGELTAGEKERLKQVLQDKNMQEAFENIHREGFWADKLDDYSGYPAAEAFRHFVKKVGGGRRKKTLFIRLAVSAAVIFLLVGVPFLIEITQSEKNNMLPALPVNSVVMPGEKKAQLRLADGRIVDVTGDSMQIRESDGTQIKIEQGKVSYETLREADKLVYNELIVPLAGECYITLDDGTRVWINSDSRLKYPLKFIGDERKVFLQGEAYFEVVKAGKPFIVSTDLGNIRVLGTTFDVKAYREENKLYATLVTGKVCYQGREKIMVYPGEQVVALPDGRAEKRKVDIDEYIGWKNGLYVFKEHTLESIMTDLARWYNVSVFYQNPELRRITFTGNLKRYDSINTFMEILQRTGDVRYSIKENTILLFK